MHHQIVQFAQYILQQNVEVLREYCQYFLTEAEQFVNEGDILFGILILDTKM